MENETDNNAAIKLSAEEIQADTIKIPEREEQNCGNCRFWYKDGKQCRKYCPKVVWFSKTEILVFTEIVKTVFPETEEVCWCGEWEVKTDVLCDTKRSI